MSSLISVQRWLVSSISMGMLAISWRVGLIG